MKSREFSYDRGWKNLSENEKRIWSLYGEGTLLDIVSTAFDICFEIAKLNNADMKSSEFKDFCENYRVNACQTYLQMNIPPGAKTTRLEIEEIRDIAKREANSYEA